MKTDTRDKILAFIQIHVTARPHDLIEHFQITAAAIHRHLTHLQAAKLIEKVGKPPHVFYKVSLQKQKSTTVQISSEENDFLNQHYLYIDATGNTQTGWNGFQSWLKSVKEEKHANALVREYIKTIKSTNSFFHNGLIDATKRFDDIFEKIFLERIYYLDFYSLPKFGKTKLGQLVLHGKQAQDHKIIAQLADDCKASLMALLKNEKIQAIAWTPHSLPRKLAFLKEFEKRLKLPLPKIELVKAYSGDVPVAQKTLSKLEDRITNARETILIKAQKLDFKRVLLIDDAVGSGATLNEAAFKLKSKGVKEVIGFALVGSYKGFEVIKEI